MLDIFKDVVNECLIIYMEDIIIYFRMYEQHVTELKKVLQKQEEQKFYINESKCQFFARKLEILVHVFTLDTLHINPKKRKTIIELLNPACKNNVCRLLGVVNYLCAFLLVHTSDASAEFEL